MQFMYDYISIFMSIFVCPLGIYVNTLVCVFCVYATFFHFNSLTLQESHFKPCQMKTYFQLPFPVNFVSECVRTVPFTHNDFAR